MEAAGQLLDLESGLAVLNLASKTVGAANAVKENTTAAFEEGLKPLGGPTATRTASPSSSRQRSNETDLEEAHEKTSLTGKDSDEEDHEEAAACFEFRKVNPLLAPFTVLCCCCPSRSKDQEDSKTSSQSSWSCCSCLAFLFHIFYALVGLFFLLAPLICTGLDVENWFLRPFNWNLRTHDGLHGDFWKAYFVAWIPLGLMIWYFSAASVRSAIADKIEENLEKLTQENRIYHQNNIEMKQNINKLEITVKTLEADLLALEQVRDALEESVAGLHDETQKLQSTNAELEQNVEGLGIERSKMQSANEDLQVTNENLLSNVNDLSLNLKRLNMTTKILENTHEFLRNDLVENVGPAMGNAFMDKIKNALSDETCLSNLVAPLTGVQEELERTQEEFEQTKDELGLLKTKFEEVLDRVEDSYAEHEKAVQKMNRREQRLREKERKKREKEGAALRERIAALLHRFTDFVSITEFLNVHGVRFKTAAGVLQKIFLAVEAGAEDVIVYESAAGDVLPEKDAVKCDVGGELVAQVSAASSVLSSNASGTPSTSSAEGGSYARIRVAAKNVAILRDFALQAGPQLSKVIKESYRFSKQDAAASSSGGAAEGDDDLTHNVTGVVPNKDTKKSTCPVALAQAAIAKHNNSNDDASTDADEDDEDSDSDTDDFTSDSSDAESTKSFSDSESAAKTKKLSVADTTTNPGSAAGDASATGNVAISINADSNNEVGNPQQEQLPSSDKPASKMNFAAAVLALRGQNTAGAPLDIQSIQEDEDGVGLVLDPTPPASSPDAPATKRGLRGFFNQVGNAIKRRRAERKARKDLAAEEQKRIEAERNHFRKYRTFTKGLSSHQLHPTSSVPSSAAARNINTGNSISGRGANQNPFLQVPSRP